MGSEAFIIKLNKAGKIAPDDKRIAEILRWQNIDLFMQPLSFIFPPDAHGRVDSLFENTGNFKDVVFPKVPLRFKPGGYINFDMKIFEHEDGTSRLEFYKPGIVENADVATADMYSFFNFVGELLNSPLEGDIAVNMIEVEGLKAGSGLSDDEQTALRGKVESELKKKAVGGKVGKLDEASYGLLSGGDFDEVAFEKELEAAAVKLNISPDSLGIRAAKVKIDDREIDPATLKMALSHSRSIFLGEIDSDDELDNLSDVISGIQHNCNLVNDAIKKFQFMVISRQINDITKSESRAVLQQGKVNIDGRLTLPGKLIVMYDHPDIAYSHDMAQIDEMLRVIKFAIKSNPDVHYNDGKLDYYELCRSTLLNDKFIPDLTALMKKHEQPTSMLGFRILEMPPSKKGGVHWDTMRKLDALDHSLWIDRFGDAVIDDSLMKLLHSGYVEMPLQVMKKLAGHFDGKDMMSQLVDTWRDKGVGVVAADLPDIKMKQLAHDIGIKLNLDDAPEGS